MNNPQGKRLWIRFGKVVKQVPQIDLLPSSSNNRKKEEKIDFEGRRQFGIGVVHLVFPRNSLVNHPAATRPGPYKGSPRVARCEMQIDVRQWERRKWSCVSDLLRPNRFLIIRISLQIATNHRWWPCLIFALLAHTPKTRNRSFTTYPIPGVLWSQNWMKTPIRPKPAPPSPRFSLRMETHCRWQIARYQY